MKNIKRIIVSIGLCGILVFVGIGLLAEPKDTTIPTLDNKYLSKIHSYNNQLIESSSDEALVGIGKSICSDLMYGYSLNEVIELRMADQSENSRLLFGYVLMTATDIYCPDFKGISEELDW